MIDFLFAFVLLCLAFAAMCLGVIFGRKPIKGSCGGIGALGLGAGTACDICGDDPSQCVEEQEKIYKNIN